MQLVLETRIDGTPRVTQLRGLFDLPEQPQLRRVWEIALPLTQRDWSIGLITGPSGSGKSSIARHCFPTERGFLWMDDLPPWPSQRAVVDGFPPGMAIREITEWLSTVGFSSPPAWLQPAHTLSTGQRFRADLARLLATAQQQGRTAVCDEFTSVVDRTVAQIGSAAIAKAVRRQRLRFIAVTCHADVEAWLQPEWRFRPELAQRTGSGPESGAESGSNGTGGGESAFVWRLVQRRPQIAIDLVRTTSAAWPMFAPHHYLSHRINPASVCFLALHRGEPIGFSAWINHFSTQGGKREHRTVVMPDWQGVGVGMAMAGTLAAMWRGLGFRATSTTTHPGLITARYRHPHWLCTRAPGMARPGRWPTPTQPTRPRSSALPRHATQRLTAGFRYIGPAMSPTLARWLLNGTTPVPG